MPDRIRLVMAAGVVAGAGACAAIPISDGDDAGADDPGGEGFQDCEPPYVFDGESTMAALGIDAEGLDHELTMPGRIRITQDTVTHAEFAPPDTPVFIEEGQVLCVEWAGDLGGMAMMLREPWPPNVLDPASGLGSAGTLATVALVVAVAVIAGVSLFAFGRRPGGGSRADET